MNQVHWHPAGRNLVKHFSSPVPSLLPPALTT